MMNMKRQRFLKSETSVFTVFSEDVEQFEVFCVDRVQKVRYILL
jgi:hypothetical protein